MTVTLTIYDTFGKKHGSRTTVVEPSKMRFRFPNTGAAYTLGRVLAILPTGSCTFPLPPDRVVKTGAVVEVTVAAA